MIKKSSFFLVAFCCFLCVVAVSPAPAYDLPPVNLGFTSFLDGGPPAGPGLYFQQYFQYYNSDTFKDKDGHNIPFPDPELNAFISLSQFIYQSNQTVPLTFGGKWGMDVIMPIVGFDLSGTPLSENDGGLGDLLVGPYIQWDPIMGKSGPIFMHRVEFQTTFPTGQYNSDKQLNPGSNIFTFNPYWSGTLFITPKLTASTRVHYLWCSENNRPTGGGTVQPGQAVHLNYASEYEVIPKMLRVGINGYYLKQLTETEVNGNRGSGTKEQVFAVGPGVLFSFSPNNHLFFNAFFEMETENRTEGNRFNFRWTHHF